MTIEDDQTGQVPFDAIKPCSGWSGLACLRANLSGLSTLISGCLHCHAARPPTGGKSRREFIGRENPPVLEADVPGHTFLLRPTASARFRSALPCSSAISMWVKCLAGTSPTWRSTVTIHAFVRAPYDTYVHDQTRFWNASGLSVKLAGTEVEIQLEVVAGTVAWRHCVRDAFGRKTRRGQSPKSRLSAVRKPEPGECRLLHVGRSHVVSYFAGSVSGLGTGLARSRCMG